MGETGVMSLLSIGMKQDDIKRLQQDACSLQLLARKATSVHHLCFMAPDRLGTPGLLAW